MIKAIDNLTNIQIKSVRMTPISDQRRMSNNVVKYVSRFQLSMFPRKGDAS
jgi:hypothetical protein